MTIRTHSSMSKLIVKTIELHDATQQLFGGL
jgi:hypothetical protein